MLQKIQKFLSQKGQGIVEYAMVLGFVAVLAIGLWQSGLFASTQSTFENVTDKVSTVNEAVEANDLGDLSNIQSTTSGNGTSSGNDNNQLK